MSPARRFRDFGPSLLLRHSRFRQAFATLFPIRPPRKTYTRALTYSFASTCVAGRPTGWSGLSLVAVRLSRPPTFASLRKKRTRTRLANVPRETNDSRRVFPPSAFRLLLFQQKMERNLFFIIFFSIIYILYVYIFIYFLLFVIWFFFFFFS